MFWREHAPPHFHALYAEYEVLIDIRTLEIIKKEFTKTRISYGFRMDGTTSHRIDGGLESMSTKIATQAHCPPGITAAAQWRIRSVTALPNYRLSVTCNDGTTGVVDLSQLIFSENPGIFDALKDEQYFNQVRIEMGALTWSNGADLDPVWLHEEIGKNGTWYVLV